MVINYPIGSGPTNQVVSGSLNLEQGTVLIIESARQLVSKLVEQRGHEKPPFLPEEFIHLLGFNKIVKADLGKTSAALLRFHDGYVIKVNQNHSLARQSFSCAHEIGHILFSELKLGRCLENIEYRRTYNPQARDKAREKAKERLCDAAATELLMPEFVFQKYLSGFGVSVYSIERLANIFRVSMPAAAIRIAEVGVEPCLAILWKPWPRNRPKGLRLVWCIGSGRNTMPKHTLVRHPSNLHKAYEHDNLVKSLKRFKINNIEKDLPMESRGFGYGENRYVISLAFLDR